MSPFDLLLLTLETIFFINNENSTAEVDSITKYIYIHLLFVPSSLPEGYIFYIIKGNMFFVCLLVCLFVICFVGPKASAAFSLCAFVACV